MCAIVSAPSGRRSSETELVNKSRSARRRESAKAKLARRAASGDAPRWERRPVVDRPRSLAEGAVFSTGCAGDHPSVHHLLMAIFQGPTRDAFYSSLDDPFYEPRDRLLIKRGDQIVSHLMLSKRVLQFGALNLSVDYLSWLGTLPEFRQLGFASWLMREAEETMRRDGAVLGVLKTTAPHFFRRFDWALCGRHSEAQAGSRDLLAQLSVHGLVPGEASVSIRPWRQVELPALMRLYSERTAGRAGHFERTEAYWRWLISRKNVDRVYVAIDGTDNFELEDDPAKLVGYSVVREDRVLELMHAKTHPHVGRELLARACSEAIERDYHMLSLHAPADDPLLELFRIAGGTLQCSESNQGEVHMVKLLDPPAFLRLLCAELHERAERAQLTRPCELGLLVDGEKHRLIVSRRSVKHRRNTLGRSYLACNEADFTRLLLGHLDLDEAIESGRVRASTQLAAQAAKALFPRLPLWRAPWDELAT